MIRDATGVAVARSALAPASSHAGRDASCGRCSSRRSGEKVELDVTIDPALLGGFVAKIGSEVYDASVAGKIKKFRESLA